MKVGQDRRKTSTRQSTPPTTTSLLTQQQIDGTVGVFGHVGAEVSAVARNQAEHLIAIGRRVFVLDPLGTWWGMTKDPDGKRDSGVDVTVYGGKHGTRSINPTHGNVIGEVVAKNSINVIIDMSDWDRAEQLMFAAAVLSRIYVANRAELHVFINEASLCAPQNARGFSGQKVAHPLAKMAQQGLATGIRTTLVSQRPHAISKDILSTIASVVALRLTAKPDRNAVGNSTAAGVSRDVIEGLGAVEDAKCWIWSNGVVGSLRLEDVPSYRTFDAARVEARTAPPSIELDRVDALIAEASGRVTGHDMAGKARGGPEAPSSGRQEVGKPDDRVDAAIAANGNSEGSAASEPSADKAPALDLNVYHRHLQNKHAVVMRAIGTGFITRPALTKAVVGEVKDHQVERIVSELVAQKHVVVTAHGLSISRQAFIEFHMTPDMRRMHLAISSGRDPIAEGIRNGWSEDRTATVLDVLTARKFIRRDETGHHDALADIGEQGK